MKYIKTFESSHGYENFSRKRSQRNLRKVNPIDSSKSTVGEREYARIMALPVVTIDNEKYHIEIQKVKSSIYYINLYLNRVLYEIKKLKTYDEIEENLLSSTKVIICDQNENTVTGYKMTSDELDAAEKISNQLKKVFNITIDPTEFIM